MSLDNSLQHMQQLLRITFIWDGIKRKSAAVVDGGYII
jgi:hypothetical protein